MLICDRIRVFVTMLICDRIIRVLCPPMLICDKFKYHHVIQQAKLQIKNQGLKHKNCAGL